MSISIKLDHEIASELHSDVLPILWTIEKVKLSTDLLTQEVGKI